MATRQRQNAPAALHAQALENDLNAAVCNLEGRARPERVLLASGSPQGRKEDAVLRYGEDLSLNLELLALRVRLLGV